jgi:Rrf2 family nitric oxide-sensitive transcriptional repressor
VKVTTFTDYSLRVLIHVATSPEGRATIAEVARAYDISEHHLVKVVHLLGREGFLLNTRGRGGGLKLAVPAAQLRVGRVVRATEGDDGCVDCAHCAIADACKLSAVFAMAMESFYRVLDGYTLADLVANRRPLAAILHRMPAPA